MSKKSRNFAADLNEDGFDCLQPRKNNAKTCATRPNSHLWLIFLKKHIICIISLHRNRCQKDIPTK